MFKNETLAKKIEEYKNLKDQVDVLNAKIDSLKEEFIADLTERGVDSYEFILDDVKHSVSYKTSTRTNFDTKAFKEEYGKLYEQFSSVAPQSRFSCK